MRIYNLSKSARDEVLEKLASITNPVSLKSKDLKIAESDGNVNPPVAIIFNKEEGLYLGKRPVKGDSEGFFPLLKDQKILPSRPVITVDSGAVKFLCNGANVMRPGIVKIEGDFGKSELVLVKEQKYGKAIVVGTTVMPRKELESASKGPVIENLHYVGDRFWDALKEIE